MRLFGVWLISCVIFSFDLSAKCGKVSIAEMNWPSASFLAQVDGFILQHGFHCLVQLVPGDTMPTSISMIEKGEPDIAPELWTIGMKKALEKGIAEKRLYLAGLPLAGGGEEGFWVPQYLVKKYPEISTISGVKKHARLFTHAERKNKSAFMGCPSGWNCQITAKNLFRALGLKKFGFELIDPGSGAGLKASLTKAYERRQPWLGYYWSPTSLLSIFKMVKVDFESGVDEEHFVNCISQENCNSPQVTMYPPSPVQTLVTEKFAKKNPSVMVYLKNRAVGKKKMKEVLAWMQKSQADGEMAAQHFLKNQKKVWTSWVDPATRIKIEKILRQ